MRRLQGRIGAILPHFERTLLQKSNNIAIYGRSR